MSRGAKKPSLYDLSKQPITPEHHTALLEELVKGSHRSTALVGCAMVDAALVKAISTHFVMMDETEFEKAFYDTDAALSTLSARTKIAVNLGIFADKLSKMIDTIRRIRNAFAHCVIPLTFENELVAKECEKLPVAAKLKPELSEGLNPHRERYLATCVNIVIALEDHAKRHGGRPIRIDMV